MKRVLRRLLLILPVFLFLLGHGAKFGFCPCEDSFFLSACECSFHKQAPALNQETASPCCDNIAVHQQKSIRLSDDGCDDIMAEFPDLPYQSSSTSLQIPPFSAIPLRIEELLSLTDVPRFFLSDTSFCGEFPFDQPLSKTLYTGFLSPMRA